MNLVNNLIDMVPGFINKNVMKSTVGDTVSNYQDNNGNISADNFNAFVSDSVDAPFGLGSVVADNADGIFNCMNTNGDNVVSQEELSNYLYNYYGVKYDEIEDWSVEEFVDLVVSTEKGEVTAQQTRDEMAQLAKLEEQTSKFAIVEDFIMFLCGGRQDVKDPFDFQAC